MQGVPQILLIEDNVSLAHVLSEVLHNEFQLDLAPSGKPGLYKSDHTNYDLIVLDLNLPDIPGLAVCQQLRERGLSTPILILSAETKVLSKISLLNAGANDYLTKPFSLGELKARLRALLRQHHMLIPKACNDLVVGNLQLNSQRREVYRDGHIITLRRKEFLLLEYLMVHVGQVVTRESLMRHAWNGDAIPWANTIDVHIKYLRDKIDRPFESSLIQTVHGVGYKLTATTEPQKVASL